MLLTVVPCPFYEAGVRYWDVGVCPRCEDSGVGELEVENEERGSAGEAQVMQSWHSVEDMGGEEECDGGWPWMDKAWDQRF